MFMGRGTIESAPKALMVRALAGTIADANPEHHDPTQRVQVGHMLSVVDWALVLQQLSGLACFALSDTHTHFLFRSV